jgi:predicted GNAT family acetyltransferase
MALFAKDQLAAYLQVDVALIADATYEVIELKIRTEIINLIGQARFDATDETKFFSVALDMAKRLYQNASGLRSEQATIDDYTRTLTYASETVVPFEASIDEQRRIRRAAGLKNAFTIRVFDERSRSAC